MKHEEGIEFHRREVWGKEILILEDKDKFWYFNRCARLDLRLISYDAGSKEGGSLSWKSP